MDMGSHTQINAAVFITVYGVGVPGIHILVCVYILGPTAPEWPHTFWSKHMVNNFQFKYMKTYWAISSNL